jgi:hypothetical protein
VNTPFCRKIEMFLIKKVISVRVLRTEIIKYACVWRCCVRIFIYVYLVCSRLILYVWCVCVCVCVMKNSWLYILQYICRLREHGFISVGLVENMICARLFGEDLLVVILERIVMNALVKVYLGHWLSMWVSLFWLLTLSHSFELFIVELLFEKVSMFRNDLISVFNYIHTMHMFHLYVIMYNILQSVAYNCWQFAT